MKLFQWSIFFLCIMNQLLASSRFSHQLCGLYGMPPCTYVPAPPGVTPICASPGKTYCDSVHQYPIHTVRRLIAKWGEENARDLIVDESIDEFDATRTNLMPPGSTTFSTSPNFPIAHNSFQFDEGYNYPNPNKVNINLKPANNFYGNVPRNNDAAINSVGDNYPVNPPPGLPYTINQRQPAYNYRSGDQNHHLYQPYLYKKPGYYRANNYVTEYNPTRWFKRYVRDLSTKSQLLSEEYLELNSSSSIIIGTPLADNLQSSYDGTSNYRVKRQSPGRQQLCQTNYQYITPQAALNSQGNWMYVVNQVDTSRQLVRTETCASSVCSNLCQLPNGYSSRCEQKYVQKRLIALNGDGTNLYTDTFWFPSCCACTISN